MKPKSPFTQTFAQLPASLPIYVLENALLPGGELPLELAGPAEIALFLHALRHDQLVGMVQPQAAGEWYEVGCAGRIRQYRERKDGRLNVMLSGICRYRIRHSWADPAGFSLAEVDWSGYQDDYLTAQVEPYKINYFKDHLRHYFDSHRMQVDWPVLDQRPIEEVVNNLVLIMGFGIEQKQALLEADTVLARMNLFEDFLEQLPSPIVAPSAPNARVN